MTDAERRLAMLQDWVDQRPQFAGQARVPLEMVSGDASFRRYFRLQRDGGQWIAVDAPPEHEDSRPFVAIDRCWHAQGIRVPALIDVDLALGFMLLEDFGDRLYLGALTEDNADDLYRRAIDSLLAIQRAETPADYPLPDYDEALLRREMALFRDWLCRRLLKLDLAADGWFGVLCDRLVASARQQPQVPVHRDYHSRNLMLIDDGGPGILDFQDAVIGPVSYDLVSLLRDCYIRWPRERVRGWLLDYAKLARGQGLLTLDDTEFERCCDLMGVQRHLKASGIFARLCLRDGKHGYLGDIPQTLDYLLEMADLHPELAALGDWIRGTMRPAMLAHEAFRDSPLLQQWVAAS